MSDGLTEEGIRSKIKALEEEVRGLIDGRPLTDEITRALHKLLAEIDALRGRLTQMSE